MNVDAYGRSMPEVVRGALLDPSDAPVVGERIEEIARVRNLVIEQILSGKVEPTEYQQAHDEWVVVLAGGATLAVGGAELDVGPGDWVLLPAGTPHRLVRTQLGTVWLAVHLHPPQPAGKGSGAER